jgi:hypothetical protein
LEIAGGATASSNSIYFLKADFAALLNPAPTGAPLDAAIEALEKEAPERRSARTHVTAKSMASHPAKGSVM